jgi:hypothetical protein
MVEIADEEFTIIKSFLVDDMASSVDWDNAPDNFKEKYTSVLQIVNSFGPEEEAAATSSVDQGVAAPGA